eukprot:scaffold59152_cov76-Cyclotella_meneghiniana.AAC.4
MDNQFASQLANLQRVASRTNGDDGNDPRRRDDRRDGRDRNNNEHSNHSNNGRDGGYRRYNDNDRKRRRDENDNHHWHNDRQRHDRRSGRGHHHHRQQPYDRYDNRRRDEDYRQRLPPQQQQQQSREPYVPLADVVSNISNQHDNNKSINDDVISADNADKRRHVALLFLTIDDLPHEHVWREWLKGNIISSGTDNTAGDIEAAVNQNESESNNNAISKPDDMMVSIICHAKHPERITSPWLRQRHLIRFQRNNNDTGNNDNNTMPPPKFHSRRPEWGSIEITRGMIDLLEEGLRIGNNKKEGDDSAVVTAQKGDGGGSKSSDGAITTTTTTTTTSNDVYSSYRRYLSTPKDALSRETSNDASCIPSDHDIPPVDRFIFVSESCLPVTTLNEMEMALFGPRSGSTKQTTDDEETNKLNPYDKSWVNARSTPNNGYSRQLQWDEIRPSDIPANLIWKADQWIVLNRSHGEAVASLPAKYLNGRTLWYAFRRCRAPDEMYFPTALAILGVIARPTGVKEVDDVSNGNEKCAGDQIRRRKVTYCDWSVSAKNPASFTAKDLEEVTMKARREGCLLARKFVPLSRSGQVAGGDTGIVSVEDWSSLMQKLTIK